MGKNTTGRNEPCPCGSGLKYKKCCLVSTAAYNPPKKRRLAGGTQDVIIDIADNPSFNALVHAGVSEEDSYAFLRTGAMMFSNFRQGEDSDNMREFTAAVTTYLNTPASERPQLLAELYEVA